MYHRIFGVVSRFRWALWVSAFLITGYWIGCSIAAIFGCTPVSFFWDKNQPGSCMDEVNFFRWNGVANIFLDFLILLLPLPMLWRMRTSRRQKLILTGIFLLGGLYDSLSFCLCERLLYVMRRWLTFLAASASYRSSGSSRSKSKSARIRHTPLLTRPRGPPSSSLWVFCAPVCRLCGLSSDDCMENPPVIRKGVTRPPQLGVLLHLLQGIRDPVALEGCRSLRTWICIMSTLCHRYWRTGF